MADPSKSAKAQNTHNIYSQIMIRKPSLLFHSNLPFQKISVFQFCQPWNLFHNRLKN